MKKTTIPIAPDPIFSADYYEWVEDARYELVYVRHKYVFAFKGRCKLFVDFRITDPGVHFGKTVMAFYNVHKKGKKYNLPRNGRLSREMATLFGRRALRKSSPFSLLKSVAVIGETRTVVRDSQNKTLSDANKYSVIDSLHEISAGGGFASIPYPCLSPNRSPNPVKTSDI